MFKLACTLIPALGIASFKLSSQRRVSDRGGGVAPIVSCRGCNHAKHLRPCRDGPQSDNCATLAGVQEH
jgi:hypothetical protein